MNLKLREALGRGRTGIGVAAVSGALSLAAHAADGISDRDAPAPDAARELRTVLFGSAEIGASTYLGAGFKRALGPSLDTTGFVAMGSLGWGDPGGLRAPRMADLSGAEASLLLGHQWAGERTVMSLLAGPEFDGGSASGTPAFGARLLAELWAHPSPETLATGTLVIGSAPLRLWSRASFGWRVGGEVFAGPEAVLSLEEDYREARLGLHLTGLRVAAWTLRLSGGLLLVADERPGAYLGLTTVYKP